MRSSLLFVLVLLGACTSSVVVDESAIRLVMDDQEAAWDRGDIEAFMAGYSDTVCFIGSRGRTCGREPVTANYKKSYPDKSAMGDLTFRTDEVLPVGDGHAWATGRWTLVRATDTLQGGYTLLWVKEQMGWRIARDHSY